MKDWRLFVLLLSFLRGGKRNTSWGLRLFLIIIFVTLFIWLIVAYVVVKLTLSVTRALFVCGEGRQIYGGSSPLLRQSTVYRALARAFDYLLIAAVVTIAILFIQLMGVDVPDSVGGISLLAGLLYFPLATQFGGGTTLGKAVFGLEVTSTVGRLSLTQLGIREIIFLLSLGLWPLALYVVMKNEEGEQAGDVVTDTLVVENGPGGIAGLSQFANDLRASFNGVGTPRPSSDVHTETTLQETQPSTQSRTETGWGQSGTGSGTAGATGGSSTEVYDGTVCDSCKRLHDDDSAYCPHCGTEVR